MYWTRALQYPTTTRLCKRTCDNYLRTFSTTSSNGFLAKKSSSSTAPPVPHRVEKTPRKTVYVMSRSLATSAGVEQGGRFEERDALWKAGDPRKYMAWPTDMRMLLQKIKSSTATISLPNGVGQSTGTIISPDGYIATSGHLFSSIKTEDLPKIKVNVSTPKKMYEGASVVFVDKNRNLAILKINPMDDLLEVPLFTSAFPTSSLYVASGSRSKLLATQYMGKKYQLYASTLGLEAIHNGQNQHEFLKLSPVDIEFYFTYLDGVHFHEGFRKNYGGPLVDSEGKVFGILTTTNSNIEYAMPIYLVFKHFQAYIENSKDEEPSAELIEDRTPKYIYTSGVSDSNEDEDIHERRSEFADDIPIEVVETPITPAMEDTKSTVEGHTKAEAKDSDTSSDDELSEDSGSDDVDTSSSDTELDSEIEESKNIPKCDVDGNPISGNDNNKEGNFIDVVKPALLEFLNDIEKLHRQTMQIKAPKVDEIDKLHDMVKSQAKAMDIDEVTKSDLVAVASEIRSVKEAMLNRYEAQKEAEIDHFVGSLNEVYVKLSSVEREVIERYDKVFQAIKSVRGRVCEMQSQAFKGPKKE